MFLVRQKETTKKEIKMKKSKKKKSLYEEMVTDLSAFVIRTAKRVERILQRLTN